MRWSILLVVGLGLPGPAEARQADDGSRAGLVAVGERALWVECAGAGAPTLILEAGARSTSATWDPVWDALVELTRTCRYDRAGLGRSPAAEHTPAPGFAEPVAATTADLEALIHAVAPEGPLLLVAHSAGALYTRLYAHRHPERVTGLVLVDGLEEGQRTRVLALDPPDDPADARAWVGYVEGQRARQRRTPTGEDEAVAVMRAARDLGDLPMEILSASHPMGTAPEGFARGMLERMAEAWAEGQRLLATMSSRARRQVVPDTGHNLHRDRPDVVVEAVRRLVEEARGAASLPAAPGARGR